MREERKQGSPLKNASKGSSFYPSLILLSVASKTDLHRHNYLLIFMGFWVFSGTHRKLPYVKEHWALAARRWRWGQRMLMVVIWSMK